MCSGSEGEPILMRKRGESLIEITHGFRDNAKGSGSDKVQTLAVFFSK